uniref:Unique cartilage matrix-associated protein n=1 Tax=Rousettus aegyptiacus TaxID=9407 RepID=A0A7J8EBK1_ROUAE|nr:upper zone of growth plate and cartilage matrix associated [Rousettus aegyptiacus]
MVWKQLLLVSCLSAAMFLSSVKQVFVPESDALNFLRRNGRRSPRPPQEINEENRQHPGANERQVEYYEERQYEYENFAEEQIDEYARSQEANEQWRWRGYNGLYPPYPSDRRRV